MQCDELEREIADVEDLLRQVKPEDAEKRMWALVTALAAEELRAFEDQLRSAIRGFRHHSKKRMRRLEGVLDDEFANIWQKEMVDRAIAQLRADAGALEATAHSWTQSEFESALQTVENFQATYRELALQFGTARERSDQIASEALGEASKRLVALLQERVVSAKGEIIDLEVARLDVAFAVLHRVKQSAAHLSSVFPDSDAVGGCGVDDVSLTVAKRFVQEQVPLRFAWKREVAQLINQYAELLLAVPNVEKSCALAVGVLLFPHVAELVSHGGLTGGILGHARALREYAQTRPPLEDTTQFTSLKGHDLILATHYASNARIRGLIERRRIDSVASLRAVLGNTDEDRHECNKFLVEGLQPRIAEIAFFQLFGLIANDDIAGLRDLNREELERGLPDGLPHDDFSNGDRRFDVKSNRYYTSKEARIGLRGFQLNVSHRNPNAELAGFVFSRSSGHDAAWSFVGFSRENEVPPGANRAAPFLFSLPDHFHFQGNDLTAEAELLKLLLVAGRDACQTDHFGPADRAALARSLGARVEGTPLTERVLWDESTNGLVELRNGGGTEPAGAEFLRQKESEAMSPFWLHRMASVEGRPQLSRWIVEVLQELNEHWARVRCPRCDQAGSITLRPDGITYAGTVTGYIGCKCGFERNNATFITNCWNVGKCGTYPLVIGAHGPHSELCLGLVCPNCGQCRCTNPRTKL